MIDSQVGTISINLLMNGAVRGQWGMGAALEWWWRMCRSTNHRAFVFYCVRAFGVLHHRKMCGQKGCWARNIWSPIALYMKCMCVCVYCVMNRVFFALVLQHNKKKTKRYFLLFLIKLVFVSGCGGGGSLCFFNIHSAGVCRTKKKKGKI